MRSRKILYNIIVSLGLQIVTIISGLIIPKIIIKGFGSDVNGLITSITQFLGYIVLLEAGVGGVVRAALYKPLANNDYLGVSRIIKSTKKFFTTLGIICIIFVIVLSITFPLISKGNFDYWYTFTLVIIIGLSISANYFIGLSNQVLLQADQSLYIINIVQIISTIVNVIVTIILVNLNQSIHLIKLSSSLVYIIKPIVLYYYTKKKYNLISNCEADDSALEQRWDGFGHHIAFFLHTNMDVALITLFSNFKEVSVYSIHFMVVSGVEKITNIFASSLEATFGNMIANNEEKQIQRNFNATELVTFMIITIMFTSTAILINPFIKIYTTGINDAIYYRPYFAYVITLSQAIYCLRIPYNAVVLAAGHYRQTKKGAYIEVLINFSISIILLQFIGLTGVAIGTLLAMIFRTIQFANYMSKYIIKRKNIIFIKKILVLILNVFIIYFMISVFGFEFSNINNYFQWIYIGIRVFSISTVITLVINYIFYPDVFLYSLKKVLRTIRK